MRSTIEPIYYIWLEPKVYIENGENNYRGLSFKNFYFLYYHLFKIFTTVVVVIERRWVFIRLQGMGIKYNVYCVHSIFTSYNRKIFFKTENSNFFSQHLIFKLFANLIIFKLFENIFFFFGIYCTNFFLKDKNSISLKI